MDPRDRACFNCEANLCKRVPIVESGKASDSAYWSLIFCRQRLSGHYKHLVEPTHVCTWHSDSVKDDTRYSNWRETIDLPKGGD